MAESDRNQHPRNNSHLRRPSAATRCPICLANLFNGSDKIKRLRCRHSFHRGCIEQWLSCNKNCPICRREITMPIPIPKPQLLPATGEQSERGHIRVSDVGYRPPRGLWIDQLKELIEALFKGDE